MCCGPIIRGMVGLAKALLRIKRAPDEVIESRRAVCRECPRAKPCTRNPEKKCKCLECGCLLTAKTANASEKCPLGKW